MLWMNILFCWIKLSAYEKGFKIWNFCELYGNLQGKSAVGLRKKICGRDKRSCRFSYHSCIEIEHMCRASNKLYWMSPLSFVVCPPCVFFYLCVSRRVSLYNFHYFTLGEDKKNVSNNTSFRSKCKRHWNETNMHNAMNDANVRMKACNNSRMARKSCEIKKNRIKQQTKSHIWLKRKLNI